MKGQPHKKQHYIPVCYLKGFTLDSKGLYTYDKDLDKSFPSSIKNIACSDHFYQIKEEFIGKTQNLEFDSNSYEREFFAAHIEKDYDLMLKSIRDRATFWLTNSTDNNSVVFNKREKDFFAAYIAIQFLRLPEIKKNITKHTKSGTINNWRLLKHFWFRKTQS